jgi:two-component system, chemotaxis family, chemotaxis protein CheY
MTPALTTAPSAALKPLRILYAEDMRELRQVAQVSLTRQGHQIECCVDGREAYERLAAAPDAFDVLITDHHMPNMNGLELLGTVRRTLSFKGKIVVFCSELSPQVSGAYTEFKVDAFLKKPVFPSVLREVLVGFQKPAAS